MSRVTLEIVRVRLLHTAGFVRKWSNREVKPVLVHSSTTTSATTSWAEVARERTRHLCQAQKEIWKVHLPEPRQIHATYTYITTHRGMTRLIKFQVEAGCELGVRHDQEHSHPGHGTAGEDESFC